MSGLGSFKSFQPFAGKRQFKVQCSKFKVRDRHFSGSSRSNRSNRLAVSSRRFPNLPLNIELGTLNNGAAYGPASVASTRARVEKNRRKQARKILG